MGFNGTQALRLDIDDDVEDYPENKLHGFIVQLQCARHGGIIFHFSVLCFCCGTPLGTAHSSHRDP